MKHYFIDNPVSGKNNPVDVIRELVIPAAEKAGIDYEIHQTSERGEGMHYVRQKCEEANGEPIRFYSVGGDGTLYEVVNGAYGFPNVEITCVPKGSGNDYVRLYGGKDFFLRVDQLIDGIPLTVDGLKVDDGSGVEEIAINQASMGFDAEACARQAAMKRLPGAVGHVTYLLAGFYCMLTKVNNDFHCTVDGNPVPGPFVFAVANVSRWYGSGIKVAPFADPTDGKLDFVILRRLIFWPTMFVVGMWNWQVRGNHYKKSYAEYLRGETMELEAQHPVQINGDGECRLVRRCKITTIPGAFQFVLPKNTPYFDQVETGDLSSAIQLGIAHKEPWKTILNMCKPYDWLFNRGLAGAWKRKRWKQVSSL